MTTPVKFPVAKLLKEKGFDKPIKNYYRITGSGVFNTIKPTNHNNDILQKTAGGMTYVSAPTIGEVVMWLYEKHGVYIWGSQELSDSLDFSYRFRDSSGFSPPIGAYNSPTEAYEAAIEYCLSNLI